MAGPGKKSAPSASDWLIKPIDGRSEEPEADAGTEERVLDNGAASRAPVRGEPNGPEPAQWQLRRRAGPNGRPTNETDAPATRGDDRRLQRAQQALQNQLEENSNLAAQIRELQTEMRAQAKQAKADFELRWRDAEIDLKGTFKLHEAELRDRIRELEAALAESKRRHRGKQTTSRRTTASKATTASAAPAKGSGNRATSTPTKRASRNGKRDVNEVTFEDLRELGLSITQSARLIAYRDLRGGYTSLEELKEIPGISKETLAGLRAQLTV